ncbi:MAG: hypothetical protein ACMUIA_06700 [bacterium]
MMKKNQAFFLTFFLLCFFSIAACSRYQINQPPVMTSRSADIYPRQQTKDGLIIGVDDYWDSVKSYQAFGMNLADENILPVEVIISNQGQDVFSIRGEEILLVKGNQVIYPISALHIELPRQVREYLQLMEFKDMTVRPGESRHGFLYFPFLKEEKQSRFFHLWPSEYKLHLGATRIGGENDRRLIYTITLRNFIISKNILLGF